MTSIDDMTAEIMKGLTEYADLADAELDMLTIGLINDMFTERENDDFDGWHEVAGQADFDSF